MNCYDYLSEIDSLHQVLSAVSDDDAYMRSQAGSLVLRDIDIEYTSKPSPIALPTVLNGIPIKSKSHEDKIGDAYLMINNKLQTLKDFCNDFADKERTEYMDLLVSENGDKCSNWIKCPTIVLSWDLVDSVSWTGGHNLDSKVTRFKVTKDAKTGKPIERNGKIEISARDRAAHISDQSYLRRVGRLNDVSIKGEGTVAVRSRNNVVGLAKNRSARGYNTADHSKFIVKAEGDGFRIGTGEKITDVTTLFDEISKQKLSGADGEVIRIELDGFNRAGVDVDVFIKGMHATMRKGNCSAIPLEKYDFSHYSTKVEGDKAFVTIPIKAGDLQFGSTSNVIQAGFGGSTTVTPKIPIAKGEVVFSMPKSRMQAFINALKELFSSHKGYMNEGFLKQLLRKNGVNPHDCGKREMFDVRAGEEMKHLKIAIILKKQENHYYVSDIQEIYVA